MATTTKGFRYPAGGDAVNISGDLQNLASDIDSYLPAGTLADLTSTQTLSKKSLRSPKEPWTLSATAATGTIQFDLVTQAVLEYTANASGNFVINFRGDSGTSLSSLLTVGESIGVVFINTNGATPYYLTSITIDGAAQTVKWANGAAPAAGNASSLDAYSLVITKTAATPTYQVIGSGPTKFA